MDVSGCERGGSFWVGFWLWIFRKGKERGESEVGLAREERWVGACALRGGGVGGGRGLRWEGEGGNTGWMDGGGDFFSGYVMKREGSLSQEETGW